MRLVKPDERKKAARQRVASKPSDKTEILGTEQITVYNGTQVTIIGNLGADPELRYTPSGRAVASFSVAVVMRRKVSETKWEDVNTTWYSVNVWGNAAENVAESLSRGSRVIVAGTLIARPWDDREGNKRHSWEITADAVGADLAYASVKISKTRRDHGPVTDPWSGDTAETGGNGHAAETAGEPHAAEPGAADETAGTDETAGNRRGRRASRVTRSGSPAAAPAESEPPF